MGMGTRQAQEKQEEIWIANVELARSPGHPFYERLNELLDGEKFDPFVEGHCRKFYAPRMGRPGLAPGIYFRSLLIGSPTILSAALKNFFPGTSHSPYRSNPPRPHRHTHQVPTKKVVGTSRMSRG